jgi:hypothetical protein
VRRRALECRPSNVVHSKVAAHSHQATFRSNAAMSVSTRDGMGIERRI